MLFGLLGHRYAATSYAVYGAIVAQARQPGFYLDHAVPDTVEGRFEMILLHAALLFHRLKQEDAASRRAAQEVLDLFFADMDRSLREMGVGDLSVPKKMKKLAQAYQGRAEAYGAAITAGDRDAVAAALARNLFAGAIEPAAAGDLAAYVLDAAARLAAAPAASLVAAAIPWPEPPGPAAAVQSPGAAS